MRRTRNVNLFQLRECRVFTKFGRYALGPLSSCFICASFLSLFSALASCVDLETASEECGKRTTEKHILAHWRREACAEMAQVAVFRFSSCAATAFTHFLYASHCFVFVYEARCGPPALQLPLRRIVNSLDLTLRRMCRCCYERLCAYAVFHY